MDKIDIIRVPPPPYASLLYVYYSNTTNEIQLYSDKDHINEIDQPILLLDQNISFYCENARVDLKFIHGSYDNGFFMIKDQLIFDHDRAIHHIDGGQI